ncbi:MAG: hypothetical protein AB8B92_03225 [Gammaproteobacteria bacterium]
MNPKANYVGLLVLIILGVAVGNLASSFITTKYIHKQNEKNSTEVSKTAANAPIVTTKTKSESKPNKVTRETVKLSPETQSDSHAQSETPKNPADHKKSIEQRKIDENGLRLAKTCNEWTIVHKDMQTQTSERGMNKHCAEYYDYLSFGNLPNSN